MGWDFFVSCTAFMLPKHSSKVVSFAYDGSFTDIVMLGNDILVQETSYKF